MSSFQSPEPTDPFSQRDRDFDRLTSASSATWDNWTTGVDGGRGPTSAVYPPTWLIGVIAAVVGVVAVCFIPATKALNSAGYVLGAFGTGVVVVVYRHIDLVKSRNPLYVRKPMWSRATAGLLFLGIALGSLHVYFALKTTRVL